MALTHAWREGRALRGNPGARAGRGGAGGRMGLQPPARCRCRETRVRGSRGRKTGDTGGQVPPVWLYIGVDNEPGEVLSPPSVPETQRASPPRLGSTATRGPLCTSPGRTVAGSLTGLFSPPGHTAGGGALLRPRVSSTLWRGLSSRPRLTPPEDQVGPPWLLGEMDGWGVRADPLFRENHALTLQGCPGSVPSGRDHGTHGREQVSQDRAREGQR